MWFCCIILLSRKYTHSLTHAQFHSHKWKSHFFEISKLLRIGYNINFELRSLIMLTCVTCIHFGRMIACGWVHCDIILGHEIDRIDVIDQINRIDWTYKIIGLPPLSIVRLFLALPLPCPSFSYLTWYHAFVLRCIWLMKKMSRFKFCLNLVIR